MLWAPSSARPLWTFFRLPRPTFRQRLSGTFRAWKRHKDVLVFTDEIQMRRKIKMNVDAKKWTSNWFQNWFWNWFWNSPKTWTKQSKLNRLPQKISKCEVLPDFLWKSKTRQFNAVRLATLIKQLEVLTSKLEALVAGIFLPLSLKSDEARCKAKISTRNCDRNSQFVIWFTERSCLLTAHKLPGSLLPRQHFVWNTRWVLLKQKS